MSTTPPVTRLQAREASELRRAGGEQRATSGAAELEGTAVSSEKIGERLKDLIMNHRKGLKNMYGQTKDELDESLEGLIKRGEEMARKLITEMGCSREIAKELTVLTLYDVAILIDDSDSMITEENGKRKETLIQFIDHITEICSMANESGIAALRFMNSKGGKKDWTGKSKDYLDHHSYGGVTRIGTELKKKILDKFAIGNPNQSKPLLVLIVTDGTVEGERKGHLKKVIQDCVNEREGAGKGFDAVSFQFSRIGNDSGAAQLLIDLDDDPDLGEYIDILPVEFDLERQLEDKWFVLPKILIGAILPDWDRQDDHNIVEVPDLLTGKGKGSECAGSGSEWEDKETQA
ncbi:hypothetical protein B9Z19DRAFT_977566 [Tuber borchii]|uniref:VWFA domain-containing protein n=1 Tax=Tuber borchii TaxID=42251 RepID=A0A2T6ZWL6_TUBBO|nr:hypothetical protein B9Z19DRAFT_977566 [Tuber borchii]